MDAPSQIVLSPALEVAGFLLIGASVAVWWLVAIRLFRRLPVLPHEPRRRVPWRAADVLLVFVLFELPLLIGLPLSFLFGLGFAGGAGVQPGEKAGVEHPIVDLLKADPSLATWLLCALVAVVVAPVVEEFMYRLLLQGWLESEERGARRRIALLGRLAPGVGPVLAVSLLFALRHVRWASPPADPGALRQLMVFQAVWSPLALVAALGVLRIRSGATPADLGFVREKFFGDVRLGLLAFAAVGAPIIAMQYLVTTYVLPNHVAADPIPLFVFAAVLGTVYYRTHRIMPSVVIHMALNATSVAG